jgi:hypothetical protein
MGFQVIAECGLPADSHTEPEQGAPGRRERAVRWQPKAAHDASTVTASLPDDGLDLTGLVGALRRQPDGGVPRCYRVAEFTQAAEAGLFDDGAAELDGPRWVIADEASLAGLWAGWGAACVRRITHPLGTPAGCGQVRRSRT